MTSGLFSVVTISVYLSRHKSELTKRDEALSALLCLVC